MDNQNPSQPQQTDAPPPPVAPTPPTASSVGSTRVIQPVSDMSAYTPAQTNVVLTPQPLPQVAPQSSVAGNAPRPQRTPAAAPTPETQVTQTQQPAVQSYTPQATELPPSGLQNESLQVAKVIPSLQIFAIVLLAYATYVFLEIKGLRLIVALIQNPEFLRLFTSGGVYLALHTLFSVGLFLFTIYTGVYLLVAKSFSKVNTVLSVFFFVSVVSLFMKLAGLVNMLSIFSMSAARHNLVYYIVPFVVSLLLVGYLWHVKSQVAIASIGRD